MCLLEELIKNISKDWSTLDKNELKSYMISGSIFLELIGLVISLVLFLIVDLPTSFVINIIIGFTILTLLSAIIVYNRDYLDGKYGLFYEEYKGLSYQGVVLFFIPNGISREFNKTGLKLVELLHKNKIKIIFIINGTMNKIVFEQKKNKLKNIINNNEILHDDFSNLINSDYFQYYNQKDRTGISTIFQSIKKIIKNF